MKFDGKAYTSELLTDHGIRHGFFTRNADPSPLYCQDENPDQRQRTLVFFLEALSADALALPTQVHSDIVWQPKADSTGLLRGPESDAALSTVAGLAVGVQTADCVPILLAAKNRRAVAAVHGGWRGLYAGIVAKAVKMLCRVADTSTVEVVAAVGPSIGPCCYEVSVELGEQFRAILGGGEGLVLDRSPRPYLDLPAITKRRLVDAGLSGENVDTLNLCTHCNEDRFHSYRRDGKKAGRLLSVICPNR